MRKTVTDQTVDDILETIGGTVDRQVAREFLLRVTLAMLELEDKKVPAHMAPMLVAGMLGNFIGGQSEDTKEGRLECLQLALSVMFHAFNLASNGEADHLLKQMGKGKRK